MTQLVGEHVRKSTKDQLSDALKTLLETQPLSSITVSDISNECGLSRMTFYYHFKGVRDAVSWMLTDLFRADELPGKFDAVWLDAIAGLFESMSKNKTLLLNVYGSIGQDQIQDIVGRVLFPIADEQFDSLSRRMHLSESDKTFVKRFFGNAVIGTCFEWIESGMAEDDVDTMVQRCGLALENSVMNVVKAFDKRNRAIERAAHEGE